MLILVNKKMSSYYEKLDGKSLNVFLKVMELNSVSLAAKKLGISQSNVSYTLDNLRIIFDDELFVRTKHGVVPTNFSLSIHGKVEKILGNMKELSLPEIFVPEDSNCIFSIGGSSYINDLLIPGFYNNIYKKINNLELSINGISFDIAQDLRLDRYDIYLTDFPVVNGGDIMQKRIIASDIVCFYDGQVRASPRHIEEFASACYVGLNYYGENPPVDIFENYYDFSFERHFEVYVQDVNIANSLIKGTDRLFFALRALEKTTFSNLSCINIPLKISSVPIYMLWHKKHQNNLQHIWLRNQLQEAAEAMPCLSILPCS